MKLLSSGQFFGNTDQTIDTGDLVLTNTEYTHRFVDWHYHENTYFTFLLEGRMSEVNKKHRHDCLPGTLLFHHCQESHYNIKPNEYTRGLHLELSADWLSRSSDEIHMTEGSFEVTDPSVKAIFHQILLLSKSPDDTTAISLHALALAAMGQLSGFSNLRMAKDEPRWVALLRQLLNDTSGQAYSLNSLATVIGIHPVHLSRYFPRYFNCNLGTYICRMRLCRAASDLQRGQKPATQIAAECGFSDQSHMIRCFREQYGITPFQFYKAVR